MSTQIQPIKEAASCSRGCAGIVRAPVLLVGKLFQHLLHKLGDSDAAQEMDPVDYFYPVLVEEYTLPVITRGRIIRLP
jgi:hypothetical protein